MRLGLLSTMAALLACNGLALGQAPVTIVREQAVEGMPPSQRGTIQPISAFQAPAAIPAAPAPAPIALGPTASGDLTTAPTVIDGDGCYSDPYAYRGWVTAEFLLWRFGDLPLPPLQAVVPAGNITVFAANQIINLAGGAPITTISSQTLPVQAAVATGLPGGSQRDLRDQPGYRLFAGWWLDNEKTVGFDAGYFWIWSRSQGITNSSQFLQTLQLQGFNQTISFNAGPGALVTPSPISNALFVSAGLNNELSAVVKNGVWGLEFNARTRAGNFGGAHFDLLAGPRYIQVDQSSVASQTVTIAPNGPGQGVTFTGGLPNPPTPAGSLYGSTATLAAPISATFADAIFLKNYFYGAQIGFSMDWQLATNWFVTGFGKFAIGGLRSTANLTGNNTGPVGTNGGLLVSSSDNGTSDSVDRVCFIPEGELALTWRVCPSVYLSAGYNIMYFSTMAKVGNVTTPTTTTGTLTFGNLSPATFNAVQPGFRFAGQATTLQGLDFSIEYRF
jgi:hypothetical protein